MACALADTSEAYVKIATTSEKMYAVIKNGIIPGVADNINHEVAVLQNFVQDPGSTLYHELVQTKIDAAETLGRALLKTASLMPAESACPP